MNASRMDMRRAIDYSAVANPLSIDIAILDRLTKLNKAQSLNDLRKWFYGTPQPTLSAALDRLLHTGAVKIKRNGLRQSAGYVYELG